jgi:hypothetical protein
LQEKGGSKEEIALASEKKAELEKKLSDIE